MAETLASLPGLTTQAVFAGVSFKDDTLLARMQQRGHAVWRVYMDEDLGVIRRGCGAETIQAKLTPERAREILARRGNADVVIARHIVEHAYDLRGFLTAVRTLAKPGGWVVFEVPDCTLAFDTQDITTLWEEHIVYFTPATFRHTVTSGGAALWHYERHPYAFENCLVAVTRVPSDEPPEAPEPAVLAAEVSRARAFAGALPARRKSIRALLTDFRHKRGKIALFGAGHLACTWVHLLGLRDLIEFVADDNPNKQGLFMPGSRLPIRSSAALADGDISLVLLSANPAAEGKIIAKNQTLVERGGVFASIFPSSKYSLDLVLHS
ncbi:MAG TPA: methyltransferase domain-containing protein [Candidatus Binatia bacterium]|nr:methyltransferase domain-containing protein [Candidatus Binatia bacterium]